ncbi:TPA: UvrD-helicase domain-containing protein [Candidatus Ventrenecus avicola]|nr:UvrD-helicase domain-containing protein [Candidatus Ventrenecus avicola]
MSNNERFNIEKKYLQKVQRRIEAEKIYQNKEFEDVPQQYKGRYSDVKWGDEDLVEHLQSMILKALKKLNNLEKNPYFGRIDFQRTGENEAEKIYIGKTTLTDDNMVDALVTDWRSPICTLYYDQSLGKVSYDAPQGKISGTLNLKSQIMIKDGELISVRDTDLVTDDELLIPYLSTNADSRLKNIVASIQAEQNAIIRRSMKKNIIVQGVAGSGKTTVALHRAAYLIYNEDKYNADNFMIIGPNKYFLNYISALLPDLDTENINQYTYEDFAAEFLDNSVNIKTDLPSLNISSQKALKYKTTLEYKNLLDLYITDYITSVISQGIYVDQYEVISSEKIQEYFKNLKGAPLNIFIQNLKKTLSKRIKDNHEKIFDEIKKQFAEDMKKFSKESEEFKKLSTRLDTIKKELQKGCSTVIKNYFKPLTISSINLYKNFISSLTEVPGLDSKELLIFKKQSLEQIKEKKFCFEEIPAVMYLDMILNGNERSEFRKIAHVIIDEAQDLGMFHYFMLSNVFKQATFSIFGDLAQSIYPTRGIDSWEDVNKKIFSSNCDLLLLSKSYRTTIEITENANAILKQIRLAQALPVIRNGIPVTYAKTEPENYVDFILDTIDDFKKKSYQSIGIICKSSEECKMLKEILDVHNINVSLISNEESEYIGGISLLTSELSKGLEFDGVIVTDASEKCYSSNSQNDLKLLYVSSTRALHELRIFYSDELNLALSENVANLSQSKLIRKQ